ncbi:TonB-dependent siderophore receptor [Phaeobacter sp. PT47_59]|uniref:TonB-dependent siderophore receptor n=1 Tax=Phaeobacter sp. PT47_59 TaxID=3029979 RepID=UPI0023804A5C|nr:TonB-dependent siderophore receptor [Phaeobacter sp. PT47_59]MDE4172526.1 TonB-dependent siderophore receptor [Phaeobacter sp. PT47_59]
MALRKRTRETRWKTLTTTAVLMCGTALPGWAQTVDLGTLTLESFEDSNGPVAEGETNPPTATGSKVPLQLNEVPQAVSVLRREQIEAFGAQSVSEALRYTAGVTTDVYGSDNDYDWLRIRGFQADQTGTYIDNAQNLSFAFGSFYIDPYTLERVEVLRGAASALYGGSNPGGLVNYVSKRPGGHVGELTFGLNDAGAGWVAFDFGEDVGESSAYRVTGLIEGGDKYDDLNQGLRGTLAPSYKFTTDGGTEITLLGNFHRASEKHNGSTFLPYYGTVQQTVEFGFIDPDANFSDPDWDSYERKQGTVSAIVEHQFDNGFTFTGIGRVGRADLEESYYYPFGYTGYATVPQDAAGTLSLIAFHHETETKTAQADLRYYGTVEAAGASHDLLFGLDTRRYVIDEIQQSGFGSNTVVNPTAPGTPVLGVPYQDAETTQNQLGLYFQDQIKFGGGFITTFNLRHDWVETERVGTGAFTREDSETSGRAAIAYEFDNGLTPYLTYSSFFNPIILSPADGITKPESGDQWEAGLKWLPDGGPFHLAAALFQIDRKNVQTGTWGNYSQLGEVRSQGLELEGGYDFGNGFTLRGQVSWTDVEVTADTNAGLIGKTPTLTPTVQAALVAAYEFENGVRIEAGARHRGSSFADDVNTLKVSGYTLYDIGASYAFGDGFVGNLAITNLADTRHVTGCQTVYVCSYGSGREINFSLTKAF